MFRKTVTASLAGVAVVGALGAVAIAAISGASGSAEAAPRQCSVQTLSGSWFFATEVGQFPGPEPFSGDITALGTMNIDPYGKISGIFDATVAEVAHLPGVTYAGSVSVNPDCTGSLTFEASTGAVRTDSIVVVNSDEFWGMSQDPANLWTYKARRFGK